MFHIVYKFVKGLSKIFIRIENTKVINNVEVKEIEEKEICRFYIVQSQPFPLFDYDYETTESLPDTLKKILEEKFRYKTMDKLGDPVESFYKPMYLFIMLLLDDAEAASDIMTVRFYLLLSFALSKDKSILNEFDKEDRNRIKEILEEKGIGPTIREYTDI